MQIRWLIAFATLIGGGAPSNASNSNLDSVTGARLSSNVLPKSGIRLHSPSPDESELRYYPLSNYRRYPPSIRPLLQRVALEHDHCAGTRPDARACDRMDRIVRRLERRGWCWGSEDGMASEAEKYWLRCARMPGYRRSR